MLNLKKNALLKRIMELMIKKYLIKKKVIFRSFWLRYKKHAKTLVMVKIINLNISNVNFKFSTKT